MRLSSMRQLWLSCGILAVVFSLANTRAFALTLPGTTGAQVPSTFCFSDNDNGAENEWCSGLNGDQAQPLITYLLPVNPGTHTVTVSYYNPVSGTFPCMLGVWDPAWGGYTNPEFAFPLSSNSGNATTSLTVTVPTGGQLGVWCNVPMGGTVWGINYDE